MTVQHLNPNGMHANPAFSQGIILPAEARILLIGGQNGVDVEGTVVAKGDVGKQTEKALSNLQLVLNDANATLEDLVKVTIVIEQNADLNAAFGAWMAVWGNRANPPTVTVLKVAGLAHPDFLIEIEAQAVVGRPSHSKD